MTAEDTAVLATAYFSVPETGRQAHLGGTNVTIGVIASSAFTPDR
jgi:hypothetical protein